MTNEQKLQDSFVRVLDLDPTQVNDDLKYQGVPQWDSIAHMDLIDDLENVFGVSFETEQILGMSSYARAREILQQSFGVDFSV
ncbi:MAG: acyl carrier protein [Anaerobiospirillum sp.]|nr:acyl carrier protein [Anaerobiospirillum sp.]